MAANLGTLEANIGRFEKMVKLPNFADKQAALARVCDQIFDAAGDRVVMTKHGEVPNPDFYAQIKCADLAARLAAVFTQAEKAVGEDGRDMNELELEKLLGLLRRNGYTVKKAA